MSDVDALREVPIFLGLTEDQLAGLARVVEHRWVAEGAAILREGEDSDSLFILASGSVDVSKRLGLAPGIELDGGRQKTLVRLSAPQFFGEMALLGESARTATVVADGPCELLELSRETFEELVRSDLSLGYRILYNIATVLVARLRRTDLDIVKLTIALSLALGNR